MTRVQTEDPAMPPPDDDRFAEHYFPERYLVLCPVCGLSRPLFLRRWVEVARALAGGPAPLFEEHWPERGRPTFAWFRW